MAVLERPHGQALANSQPGTEALSSPLPEDQGAANNHVSLEAYPSPGEPLDGTPDLAYTLTEAFREALGQGTQLSCAQVPDPQKL